MMANKKEEKKEEKMEREQEYEMEGEGAVKEMEGLQIPNLPQITPEMKEKMEKIKAKLDALSKKVVDKFGEYITGVALLPPSKEEMEKIQKSGGKELPSSINVLVLVNDSDVRKMPKAEVHEKLIEIIEKMAQEVDKDIKPEVLTITALKEACFDGRYEILHMIAMGAPLYDPSEMLAAIKIAELHKDMVIKKFEKYIVSYVAAGSMFRGEKSNDIDVYVIVDDTDVKKMSRAELRDKLRAIIVGMGFEASRMTGIQKQFHIQTYILTDFWDCVKDANPVIFTFLRDGVPIYDRGVFTPWKLLLQMGKIKPSPEAIDMNMEIGEKLLERIKAKLLSVVGEDLFYAVLNPSQAALMLYGLPPPTPKETISLMDEIFVKKEKMLEREYIILFEKIRQAFKDIEHGKTREVSGKDIDDMLDGAKKYLNRIRKLFAQIEERKEKESILEVYDGCVGIAKEILAEHGIVDVDTKDIEKLFKEQVIAKERLPEKYQALFARVLRAKRDYEQGKLTRQEVHAIKKDAYEFMKVITAHMQRKHAQAFREACIRFKYGERVGELIVCDDIAFLIRDITSREKLERVRIEKDGSFSMPEQSSLEEVEKALRENKHRNPFVKEKLFENLKHIFGEQLEIFLMS